MVDYTPSHDNAAWRQAVPEGWLSLYDQLMEDLAMLDPHFEIAQAKEKFGEFRLYLESYPAGAHELIDAASKKSRKTCQQCGTPGVLRATRQGYYATVCDEHAGEMHVVERDPIAASFRLGSDGFKKVDRDPLA